MPLLRTIFLNGTLGLAGYWSARYGFRMPAGLPRSLGAITLAWAWATLGMEILGSAGSLAYGPLLGWSLFGLVIGGFLWARGVREQTDAAGQGTSTGQGWEASAILALGLVVWAMAVHGLGSLLGPVKVVSDGPIYHLYFAARWWKAGRLFLVAAPFGESVVTYFPAVGDLWFAWLMVGWDGDRLAKIGQLPFLLLAALAAYASARRLGTGISAAVIATAWFMAVMPLLMFTLEPNVDTLFVAGYLLSAYFFLRFVLGDEPTGSLALGSLALGAVLGTKPSGFVFGGLLSGAFALVAVARRTSLRQTLGHLAILGLLPLVMSGYWYGRNVLLTGNPLYPLHLSAFGRVLLAGWYGSDVMNLSPFYLPVGEVRSLIDILFAVFDPRLIPVWGAALAGAWSLGSGRRPLGRWVWAFSALAVANIAVYWILVPYRTQQRFMLQAAGLIVVPLACLFDRGRWLRVLGTALLVIHLLSAQGWPFSHPDSDPLWDFSALIPNRIPPLLILPSFYKLRRGLPVEPEDVSWTLAMLAIGAGSIAVVWCWSRPGSRAKVRATLATLTFLVLSLALANPYQSDRRALFYPRFPEYYRGWLQLDARSGPSGARVAYAGTNLPYYLMGVGLRNNVQYVNVDAHRGWLMHDYQRLAWLRGESTWPNPWPTWDRLFPDYHAWLTNLKAEAIQILVVASMERPIGSLPDADSERFPIERQWAESHPESFEPLYGVVERDPNIRIYRVRPKIRKSQVILRKPPNLQGKFDERGR